MQNNLKPLEIKCQLAKFPRTPPQFAVRVHVQSGESVWLADPKATRALLALMDMGAQIAGAASHYGGPAAFAELMSATHGLMDYFSQKYNQDWFEAFHFVNDAGHCENGLYALKANYKMADLNFDSLKKFRSIESPLTGHGEAHLFPQGVLVSNGPLGSGLPQAQGLAMGDALMGKKRVTICALSDGGAMEGEAKEALAAIPGLARRGKLGPFICIVSDNRTKLSGRIESDAFSMEPTFASLKSLGWQVMFLEDGHHIQACMASIEEAINQVKMDSSQPIFIHARTIKGKGNKKSENSNSGGHGFSLKKAEELGAFLSEIYEGGEVPKEFLAWAEELKISEKNFKKPLAFQFPRAEYFGTEVDSSEKIQVGVAKALTNKRKAGLPVISVSADLQGSTGVADFHKEFPDSALDVGVAEANMISAAIGLSLTGFIPIVDTFAQFGVTKGALPITMASLSKAPIIAIFSHTGFQDAADGASHQALSFFAQVSSIPHVEVYALTSSREAESLVGQAIEDFAKSRRKGEVPPTRIFFLGRENFVKSFVAESVSYQLGTSQIIFDNSKNFSKSVCVVAAGSLLSEALEAAQILSEKQIGTVVVNPAIINRVNLNTIKIALAQTRTNLTSPALLITLEEHRSLGGMGQMLCHALKLSKENFSLQSLAIEDQFGQSAYSARDLYKKHKLDSQAVVESAHSLLKNSGINKI